MPRERASRTCVLWFAQPRVESGQERSHPRELGGSRFIFRSPQLGSEQLDDLIGRHDHRILQSLDREVCEGNIRNSHAARLIPVPGSRTKSFAARDSPTECRASESLLTDLFAAPAGEQHGISRKIVAPAGIGCLAYRLQRALSKFVTAELSRKQRSLFPFVAHAEQGVG